MNVELIMFLKVLTCMNFFHYISAIFNLNWWLDICFLIDMITQTSFQLFYGKEVSTLQNYSRVTYLCDSNFCDGKLCNLDLIIGGSRGGGAGTRAPPSGSNFLHFHAVFGKNWSNSMLAPPPLGFAPPRLGNPGSATVNDVICGTSLLIILHIRTDVNLTSQG